MVFIDFQPQTAFATNPIDTRINDLAAEPPTVAQLRTSAPACAGVMTTLNSKWRRNLAKPYRENVGPAEALTPENSAVLLIDPGRPHALVRDMSPEEFKNNVLGLAKTAKHFGLPVVLTTSRDYGPNAPILPELGRSSPPSG